MRRAAAGFTLIELMVVLVIIGVLAAMVRINVGDNNARQARQEAAVLIQMMNALREKAVLEGQEYGLRFEPQAYQLMRFEADQWQAVNTPVNMAAGLALALTLEGRDQPLSPRSNTPHVLWLSSDENTPFALHFESPPLRWQSLYSDGLGNPLLEASEVTDAH